MLFCCSICVLFFLPTLLNVDGAFVELPWRHFVSVRAGGTSCQKFVYMLLFLLCIPYVYMFDWFFCSKYTGLFCLLICFCSILAIFVLGRLLSSPKLVAYFL